MSRSSNWNLEIQGRSACGPWSPFLLDERWLNIFNFLCIYERKWNGTTLAEDLCLHWAFKELSKQLLSCHYMEFNSSVRLLKFYQWPELGGKKKNQNTKKSNHKRIHQARDRREILTQERVMHGKKQPKYSMGGTSSGIHDELWSMGKGVSKDQQQAKTDL